MPNVRNKEGTTPKLERPAAEHGIGCRPSSDPPKPGAIYDRDDFRRRTADALRDVSIDDLARATGLSAHYCSLIRLGKSDPASPTLARDRSRAHPKRPHRLTTSMAPAFCQKCNRRDPLPRRRCY